MVAAPPPGRGCPAERGLATRVADCLGSAYGTSMFTNRMPRFEPLSEEALATIDAGVDRLAAEVGVQFDHPDALELFRAAGQTVVDQTGHFDPGFLRAQAALAPPSARPTAAATRCCSGPSTGRRSACATACAATAPWPTPRIS